MPRIYYYDKFKMCREFIITINSNALRIYLYSKFKGGVHAGKIQVRFLAHLGILFHTMVCFEHIMVCFLTHNDVFSKFM